MLKTVQIGNLDLSIDQRDLQRLFAQFGAVHSARIAAHFDTGHSTGVGFVEMELEKDGDAAIAALHGHLHGDRILSVCWSNDPPAQDVPAEAMFGPMNIMREVSPPLRPMEMRGLPR